MEEEVDEEESEEEQVAIRKPTASMDMDLSSPPPSSPASKSQPQDTLMALNTQLEHQEKKSVIPMGIPTPPYVSSELTRGWAKQDFKPVEDDTLEQTIHKEKEELLKLQATALRENTESTWEDVKWCERCIQKLERVLAKRQDIRQSLCPMCQKGHWDNPLCAPCYLKLHKHMDQLTTEVPESNFGEEADPEPEEPSEKLGAADATSSASSDMDGSIPPLVPDPVEKMPEEKPLKRQTLQQRRGGPTLTLDLSKMSLSRKSSGNNPSTPTPGVDRFQYTLVPLQEQHKTPTVAKMKMAYQESSPLYDMCNSVDQHRHLGLPLPPCGHSDHLNPVMALKKIDNQQEEQKNIE